MPECELRSDWQIVIFFVDAKANHVGLIIPQHGLADLSLRGARVMPWSAASGSEDKHSHYFEISVPQPQSALEFLQQPGLLMAPIIAKEKGQRGWYLTEDAPDYVRAFRSSRSLDVENMNCVEWIVRALELGGCAMPMDILTPTDLYNWCRTHLRACETP